MIAPYDRVQGISRPDGLRLNTKRAPFMDAMKIRFPVGGSGGDDGHRLLSATIVATEGKAPSAVRRPFPRSAHRENRDFHVNQPALRLPINPRLRMEGTSRNELTWAVSRKRLLETDIPWCRVEFDVARLALSLQKNFQYISQQPCFLIKRGGRMKMSASASSAKMRRESSRQPVRMVAGRKPDSGSLLQACCIVKGMEPAKASRICSGQFASNGARR